MRSSRPGRDSQHTRNDCLSQYRIVSRVALAFVVIRTAAARTVAFTPEQEVTVVQSAGDSRLHTRENAITWASVGWAGRILLRVASEAAGVATKADFVLLSVLSKFLMPPTQSSSLWDVSSVLERTN